jgi:hypothetical protein
MTRQEFLNSIWARFFKPILIVAILAYFVRFFIYALNAESEERQFINLIGFGFVIGGLLVSISLLFAYVSKLVVANTPDRVERFFERNSRRIGIIFNIIMIAGVLCFAVKFTIQKEYGNLVGLAIAIAVTYLRQIFRPRE